MEQVKFEDGQSLDVISENIDRLKELFPEAFSEGAVNFDTLRQLLGDAAVLNEGEEKFGLSWYGKKRARQIALTPSTGTLLPCPEESVDWDITKNLFIEGDNLEVLKLLQKSYANKVKMIFIDPPYNSDNDFIYPDKYSEGLDTYLKYTGQKSEEGDWVVSDSGRETTGRKHTNWLNMIYPRLRVAKNLLSQTGVLFITIDDNEQSVLKQVCDEIFGEENFVSCVAWQKVFAKKNKALISGSHDHILVYTKNIELWARNLLPRSDKQIKAFKNPDNDPRGAWQSVSFSVQSENEKKRIPYRYKITLPSGREVMPPAGRHWNGLPDKYDKLKNDNRIWFGAEGDSPPREKVFLTEVQGGIVPDTWWRHEDSGNNQEAKKEILELFGEGEPFSTPKPTRLIERMLQISTSNDSGDIVLDFFSGSATTAHAVLKSNSSDQGNRRYIMVQLPEPTGRQDYKNIFDIGVERVRLAANKIKSDNPLWDGDIGYKVFRLCQSNIKTWNPDASDLDESLLANINHIVEGRTELDILYELLLKRGVDLAVPIESREIGGKNIYSIGYGVLFACLDESINREQVEDVAQGILNWHKELAPSSETHVFFRDSAFRDDVSKTNMAAILEQNGISHVRSL
ncbi:site-specific DNA-methyltransferase [Cobetia sp. QF-1]|uniref:site-specific DNA-methyltransferase n=1 Tax=Cobetia sp. QF-1 TaxID=1969833 RepID=UPI000B547A5B|nr:site-specific DNA-methyltransferase [Cobetia sp. QF-1]